MTGALDIDGAVSSLAAAIGESTRARILLSLMDGCARTGTELVALAEVSPSTVSAHLHRLQAAHLVTVRRQGKNRYYSLSSGEVASMLERLSVLAGGKPPAAVCKAPEHLRAARTCYDHIAGTIGVTLRDRFAELGWLRLAYAGEQEAYELTPGGVNGLTSSASTWMRRAD
jgi:DNA-binding transcriptional ArsR family regulator